MTRRCRIRLSVRGRKRISRITIAKECRSCGNSRGTIGDPEPR